MTTPGTTIHVVEEMTGERCTIHTERPPEIVMNEVAWQAIRYLFPQESWLDDFGNEDGGDTAVCDPPPEPADLAAALHIYEDGTILCKHVDAHSR